MLGGPSRTGTMKRFRYHGEKINFIVSMSSLKWNRCVVVFGKTEMGNVDVTVVARLKEKHICIERERTRAGKGGPVYLGK